MSSVGQPLRCEEDPSRERAEKDAGLPEHGFLAMLFPRLFWRRATQIFALLESFDFIF